MTAAELMAKRLDENLPRPKPFQGLKQKTLADLLTSRPGGERIVPLAQDEVIASYKGIGIELRPVELQKGGWKADFNLTEEVGSESIVTQYHGEATYPTRDMAKVAALDSARVIIDGK